MMYMPNPSGAIANNTEPGTKPQIADLIYSLIIIRSSYLVANLVSTNIFEILTAKINSDT